MEGGRSADRRVDRVSGFHHALKDRPEKEIDQRPGCAGDLALSVETAGTRHSRTQVLRNKSGAMGVKYATSGLAPA